MLSKVLCVMSMLGVSVTVFCRTVQVSGAGAEYTTLRFLIGSIRLSMVLIILARGIRGPWSLVLKRRKPHLDEKYDGPGPKKQDQRQRRQQIEERPTNHLPCLPRTVCRAHQEPRTTTS